MKGSLTEKTRDGDGLAVAKNDRFQDVAPPNSTKPKIASECVAILLKYPKYRNSRMNFFSNNFQRVIWQQNCMALIQQAEGSQTPRKPLRLLNYFHSQVAFLLLDSKILLLHRGTCPGRAVCRFPIFEPIHMNRHPSSRL
ncbi:MAG: hypothetical protein WBE58_14170, partial [Verrucomicrobiales bacterium]